jgi:hypothetical protein
MEGCSSNVKVADISGSEEGNIFVGFEDLIVVLMKSSFFLGYDTMQCTGI